MSLNTNTVLVSSETWRRASQSKFRALGVCISRRRVGTASTEEKRKEGGFQSEGEGSYEAAGGIRPEVHGEWGGARIRRLYPEAGVALTALINAAGLVAISTTGMMFMVNRIC